MNVWAVLYNEATAEILVFISDLIIASNINIERNAHIEIVFLFFFVSGSWKEAKVFHFILITQEKKIVYTRGQTIYKIQ